MSSTQHNQFTIDLIEDPAEFYNENQKILDEVGANGFNREAEEFAVQVAERFNDAGFAHIFRLGTRIVGFALYSLIPLDGRYLWRRCAI